MNRHRRKTPVQAPAPAPAATAIWRDFSDQLGLHRLCDGGLCRRIKRCRGKGDAAANFRCWDAARAAVKRQIEDPQKDVEQLVAEYRAKLERMFLSLADEKPAEAKADAPELAEDEMREEILDEPPAAKEARDAGPRARVV